MANLALQSDFLHSIKIFYRHTTSINTLYVIIELLTYIDTPKCHRSPPFSGGGFILPLIRDIGAVQHYRRNKMNKDLALVNILSLHQELMNATEMNELYCNQNDLHMSELWLHQMDLIVEEMKTLGGDK